MAKITFIYLPVFIGIAIAIIQLSRTLRNMIRSRKRKLTIGLTGALLAAVICYGSLYLWDLPCLLTGELETASGRVVEHDSAGREDVSGSRGITIETESGERVHLVTIDTPVYQDEYLQIACLPHTHIGFIVERNAE